MGVTLELKDGILQGEGVPIDVDDDHCDITLRRRSSSVSQSAVKRSVPESSPEDAQGTTRFAGVWTGLAVDKPEDGSSSNSLTVVLKVNEYSQLTGEALGGFVKDDRCKLENLKISGNRISFELAHRIENLRMGVTLELRDGKLKGEGSPINFDEDRCDIVLQRESS